MPLIINGGDGETFKEPLSHLMHIRTVQDFSPSHAVAPLNAVKHIVREILASDKETEVLIGELYDFEFAVDLAMLAAFDLYMECKETVYQIRIREIKSGSHILTDSACPSKVLSNIENFKSVESKE